MAESTETVGRRIQSVRKHRGLSQKDLRLSCSRACWLPWLATVLAALPR